MVDRGLAVSRGASIMTASRVLTFLRRRERIPHEWNHDGASTASWFETRGVAALLTMRVQDLILRSAHLRASRRMKPSN